MMLCRALCQAIYGFKNIGVEIPQMQPRHFDCWFMNRFEEFYKVSQPNLMTIENWKAQTELFNKELGSKLLQTAHGNFNAAKLLVTKISTSGNQTAEQEQKSSLRLLTKVCISNAILILSAPKTLDVNSTTQKEKFQLNYLFDSHPIFPILQISKLGEKNKPTTKVEEKTK